LAWTIEFHPSAKKELAKLEKSVATRIFVFLKERVKENPRSLGAALQGPKLGEFWKYRVGDIRIICKIEDGRLCVLVVKIGNRREVYR
jgi:mRNA interferase RelE/StbE